MRVLTEPRNALCKQYSQLFRLSGARFVITSAGVRAVARRALSRGTGTRSLRSIMESLLQAAMFDVADGAGEGAEGDAPRRTVLLDEEGAPPGAPPCRALCAPLHVPPAPGRARPHRPAQQRSPARAH